MTAPITESAALTRFPELIELVRLRRAGWVFRTMTDGDGGCVGLAATLSHLGHTDALFVFDRTHVVGARLVDDDDDGGGLVWFKDGGDLREVVDELSHLPAPGEPGAPTLVIKPSALWTP